ncbi:hypothetical protein WOLCODRAFT_17991 [Wolfiporia cocos MD-104 SS10]|uniref:NTF2 domain-containing protein n=1 Tax=Wolfiporia cocos (strain MD-104) TaxID=742152 RepID=A0A2H3JLV6_WOLCO|nr:hypothetical protein WOLCODRAFT_17991 [Wolfiporia cocos MD-104 SS10]
MSGPVLPPISTWTESHISDIYTATTTADFNTAFDNFLAENAHITVNGQHMSRDQYKELLLQQKTDELNARMTFNGTVTVPGDQGALVGGSVGVFFTAEITTHIIKISTISASLNVQIVTEKVHEPAGQHLPPIFTDPRRVAVLNEVLLDQPKTGPTPGVTSSSS